MDAYRGLFVAGFRHQASFKFALVSGLLTNTFFGLVRTAVFLAVYRNRDVIAELDQADAITYVWVLQAVFAVLWAPWQMELPTRIRSGEWTAELTRPGSLFGRHLAYDYGRAVSLLVLRAPVPILFAGIVFDLHLPTHPFGLAAFGASLLLAAGAATFVRFLLGAIAFWSPDFRGIYTLCFGPLYLFAGFVIPVEFFPASLRPFAIYGPLSAMLRAPVAVAAGRDVLPALALQVFWVAVLAFVCSRILDRAVDRMVVFGG